MVTTGSAYNPFQVEFSCYCNMLRYLKKLIYTAKRGGEQTVNLWVTRTSQKEPIYKLWLR